MLKKLLLCTTILLMAYAYGVEGEKATAQKSLEKRIEDLKTRIEEIVRGNCRFAHNKEKCSIAQAFILGARMEANISEKTEFHELLEKFYDELPDDLYS